MVFAEEKLHLKWITFYWDGFTQISDSLKLLYYLLLYKEDNQDLWFWNWDEVL